jgi:4-hydroxy-4-methyl-2-oxoglutarate aldolase
MKLKAEIIDLIERNRISTVEISDALGKTGVLPELTPLVGGKFVVGEVQYVYGFNESNWSIHEQVHHIKEGGVVFVDTFDCKDKAAFGELVGKYLILYKRIKGVIVNGYLRDVHSLKKESWPLWCKGITPLGCHNKEVELTKEIEEKVKIRKELLHGSILVADDSGVTIIEKSIITEETKKKLEFIEIQEDIWFYCIDTLKWSTYETVCLKKYLTQKEVLPPPLQDKLKEFDL